MSGTGAPLGRLSLLRPPKRAETLWALNNRNVSSHGSGSWKSYDEVVGRVSSTEASPWFCRWPSSPWVITRSSLWVFWLCLQMSPYKDTSHMQ